YDYRPLTTFPGISRGEKNVMRGKSLVPDAEYVHPLDSEARMWTNAIGAFEVSTSKSVATKAETRLSVNVPNPFSRNTRIYVPKSTVPGLVLVQVYNEGGVIVSKTVCPFIESNVEFDLGDLPSGIYFYRISTIDDGEVCSGHMLIQ